MKQLLKNLLLAGLTVLVIASISLLSKPASSHPCKIECPTSSLNPDLVHGMRIVGDNKVYISHKPFLNTPSEAHNFQGIFEVTLTGLGDRDAMQVYLNAQKNDAIDEYTIMPTEAFTKSDLLSGKIKAFKGQIYRGDIEECLRKVSRGTETCPVALMEDNPEVTIAIAKSIFICDFADSSCMPSTPDKQLEYILFGDDSEQYIAHRITGASDGDFDQILRLKNPIQLSPALANELAQKNYLQLIVANEISNKRENAIANSADNKRMFSFIIKDSQTPIELEIGTDSEYFIETDPNIF
jgi:hypothetical protein